mmetsp:Transcript_8314/g.17145  ORF Transcript_8314/g.17145 Transcript_8314/m.17145 type:complete len:205 (+) Transcript_8314:1001-1615(+)
MLENSSSIANNAKPFIPPPSITRILIGFSSRLMSPVSIITFPKLSRDLRNLSCSELLLNCLYQLNVDVNLFLRGRESSLYIGAVVIFLNLSFLLPLLSVMEDCCCNSGLEVHFCPSFIPFFFGRSFLQFRNGEAFLKLFFISFFFEKRYCCCNSGMEKCFCNLGLKEFNIFSGDSFFGDILTFSVNEFDFFPGDSSMAAKSGCH